MIIIDGSHGEGGGQILRTALTLAVLTGQPTRIENIRAGRRKPGLRPQHLTAVRAAAAVCDAQLEGDELGSQAISFVPGGPARRGEYTFDVTEAAEGGSAGSVGLVLQTLLLPLALTKGASYLTLRGGTHVAWAPSISYVEHVFLPTVARMGLQAEVELERWGFYPAGGGEAHVVIEGQAETPQPITMTERGALRRIWGMGVVTNLPAHIPQRMANRVRNVLGEAGLSVDVEARRLRSVGPGAGVFLFAEYEHAVAGFTAYGRKGLPAERVAEAACDELLTHHHSGAPVDQHLVDQLVLPMALAAGSSHVITARVTHHLLTNIWVVREFLARDPAHEIDIRVEGQEGSPGELLMEGSGS